MESQIILLFSSCLLPGCGNPMKTQRHQMKKNWPLPDVFIGALVPSCASFHLRLGKGLFARLAWGSGGMDRFPAASFAFFAIRAPEIDTL